MRTCLRCKKEYDGRGISYCSRFCKGKHFVLSDESRMKISKTLTGKPSTSSAKFKKGQIAWNKGKTATWVIGNKNPMRRKEILKSHPALFKKGKEHILWKHGQNCYRREAFEFKENICERCDDSNKDKLIVHHKDENRLNNLLSNLEILCWSCHNLHHRQEERKNAKENV